MGSRERILARRASFVAAALATVSVGCSRKEGADIVAPAENKPKTTKDAGAVPGVDAEAEPADPEAEPDDGPAADTGLIAPAVCLSAFPLRDAGVAPCLSIAVPKDAGAPAPKPCLKVAPPDDL